MGTDSTIPEPISITINDTLYEVAVINCNRQLPTVSRILPWFTPEEQELIRPFVSYTGEARYSIQKVGPRIPYQRWADVIAQYLSVLDRNKLGAKAEAPQIQVAYLAIGDAVWELSNARVIPPTTAQEEARQASLAEHRRQCAELLRSAEEQKRALEIEGETERKRLIEAGRSNAREVTAAAETSRREAQRLLNEARSVVPKTPPAWMAESGYPIRYRPSGDEEGWAIQIQMKVQLRAFDVNYGDNGVTREFSWGARTAPTPRLKTVLIWVPIGPEGSYNISSLFLDPTSQTLPHMSHTCACMGPGDAPPKIQNLDQLLRLRESVRRTMERVQLDSLRCDPSEWRMAFKSAIPAELYACLRGEYQDKIQRLVRQTLSANPSAAPTISVAQEESQFVFSTRTDEL